MTKEGITVTHRMLKYIGASQNGPTKERVSLLLEESISLLDKKKMVQIGRASCRERV